MVIKRCFIKKSYLSDNIVLSILCMKELLDHLFNVCKNVYDLALITSSFESTSE